MKLIAISLLLIISLNVTAKDLGKIGTDFIVAEKSMLALIHEKINEKKISGKMDEINSDFVKRVKKHINQPSSLNLSSTNQTQSFLYHPVVTLKSDILDASNNVIAPKGLSVNALTKMPYYFPYWVFVDGSNIAQVNWVKKIIKGHINAKIILTGGQIKKSAALFKHRVYFDQEGRLTQKLGIKHVPAIVKRSGDALLITEHNIEDSEND